MRITDPGAAAGQDHAMINDLGDVFYPDGPEDAAYFAEHHGARYCQPMTDIIAPHPERGTPEHAALVTAGRHPATRDALQWLTYSHLPVGLAVRSEPFYSTATRLILDNVDSPELTKSLNALTEAKDWAVRAGIRTDTGRAGSVPRPQAVVDPPSLTDEAYDRAAVAEARERTISETTPHQAD